MAANPEKKTRAHGSLALESRGLTNPKGANNCWLNATIQLLWHQDAFRKSFDKLSKFGHHKCREEKCVYCQLQKLLSNYIYTDHSSIPPDELREALAQMCNSFVSGEMGDPIEAYQTVMKTIHYHLTGNNDNNCAEKHCVVHQKFHHQVLDEDFCEKCRYHKSSEESELSKWISARDIIILPSQMKLAHLLKRKSTKCPKCKDGNFEPTQILTNPAETFVISVGWDSVNTAIDDIKVFLNKVPCRIKLSTIYDQCLDDDDNEDLLLSGVVCYYGMHYTSYIYHTKKEKWIYLDDKMVKPLSRAWLDAVVHMQNSHQQPCLLLYSRVKSKPLCLDQAPRNISLDLEFKPENRVVIADTYVEEVKKQRQEQEAIDEEYAKQLQREEDANRKRAIIQQDAIRKQMEAENRIRYAEYERNKAMNNRCNQMQDNPPGHTFNSQKAELQKHQANIQRNVPTHPNSSDYDHTTNFPPKIPDLPPVPATQPSGLSKTGDTHLRYQTVGYPVSRGEILNLKNSQSQNFSTIPNVGDSQHLSDPSENGRVKSGISKADQMLSRQKQRDKNDRQSSSSVTSKSYTRTIRQDQVQDQVRPRTRHQDQLRHKAQSPSRTPSPPHFEHRRNSPDSSQVPRFSNNGEDNFMDMNGEDLRMSQRESFRQGDNITQRSKDLENESSVTREYHQKNQRQNSSNSSDNSQVPGFSNNGEDNLMDIDGEDLRMSHVKKVNLSTKISNGVKKFSSTLKNKQNKGSKDLQAFTDYDPSNPGVTRQNRPTGSMQKREMEGIKYLAESPGSNEKSSSMKRNVLRIPKVTTKDKTPFK